MNTIVWFVCFQTFIRFYIPLHFQTQAYLRNCKVDDGDPPFPRQAGYWWFGCETASKTQGLVTAPETLCIVTAPETLGLVTASVTFGPETVPMGKNRRIFMTE